MTQKRLTVGPEGNTGPRALARELMDQHGLRGELRQIRETENGYDLRISRPGTDYAVSFDRQAGEATVRTRRASAADMLISFHVLSGLRHGFTLNRIWGVLVGLVSTGFILLGLTGIYLWFKLRSERVIGGVLLAISLGFSLTLMLSMRFA